MNGHVVDAFGSVERRAKQAIKDAAEAARPVGYPGARRAFYNLRPIEARVVLRGPLVKESEELAERRERKKANRAARRARRGKRTSPTTRKGSGR